MLLNAGQLVIFPFVTIFLSNFTLKPSVTNRLAFHHNSSLASLTIPYLQVKQEEQLIIMNKTFVRWYELVKYQLKRNGRNESLVFHFSLNDLDSLLQILDEIRQFPNKLLKVHKWWFSIYNPVESANNNQSFFSKLEAALANSSFFQNCPIHLSIETKNSSLCLVGYRLDLIRPDLKVIIKTINTPPFKPCFLHLMELAPNSLTNDFGGQTMTVITVNDSSGVYNEFHEIIDYDYQNDSGSSERQVKWRLENCFSAEVLNSMEFMLNVKYESITTKDWGTYSKENKSWTGAVVDVRMGKADLCISNLAQIKERAGVIDFARAFGKVTVSAFLRRVSKSYGPSPLLAPFETRLWIVIGIALIISSAMSCFFSQLLDNYALSNSETNNESTEVSRKIKLYRFTLSSQTFSRAILVLLLNAAYAGTLTSHLSVQFNPVKNVRDLLYEGYPFEYRIDPFPLINKFVQESPDPDIQLLYSRTQSKSNQSKLDGVSRFSEDTPMAEIVGGYFVYITEQYAFYTSVAELDTESACQLQRIKLAERDLGQSWESPAVRKGSGIKSTLDLSIQKMIETGNANLWWKRYYSKLPTCDNKPQFKDTEFWDVRLAFQVLAILGLISVGLLGAEFLKSYIVRYRDNGQISMKLQKN